VASNKKKQRSGTSGNDPDWMIQDGSVKVLADLVGYNLRRAHAVQRQRFADAFKAEGIRPVQLSILGLIHNNPRVKPSVLGKVLDIKRANIVPLVDELQSRGLVERQLSPSDGRSRVLVLTKKGETLTKKLLERHDRLEEDLVRQLGCGNHKQMLKFLIDLRKIMPPSGLD
jgi:DNA-binding MarR family transcriptional regulator